MEQNYDVIVIGGGPAGTTCSTMLAREGRKVLVLERHQFPRFHIGESITAFGAEAFKKLGVYEELKAIGYVKKKGLEFIWENEAIKVYFPQDQRNEPDELPWALQMARSKLDTVLLNNAIRNGVTVLQQRQVKRVIFEGDQAVGVEFRDLSNGDTGTKTAYAKWIVDATGQAGLINKQRKDNCYNDFLLDKKVAIFSHWTGDFEITNTDEDLNFKLCVHKNKRDWAWYIPIDKKIVSLGIVLSPNSLKNRDKGLEEIFYDFAKDVPFLCDFLKNPSLKTVDKFRSVKDYSYRSRNYYGKGWVLVGDSAGFIDPVFSTGLQITFKSGFELADILNQVLDQDSPDNSLLDEYSKRIDKVYRINSTLVYLYYLSELDLRKVLSWRLWNRVDWAGIKYRLLYIWYISRFLSHGFDQRRNWVREALFGNPKRNNVFAEMLLMLSRNFEQVHEDRIKKASAREKFIDLET